MTSFSLICNQVLEQDRVINGGRKFMEIKVKIPKSANCPICWDPIPGTQPTENHYVQWMHVNQNQVKFHKNTTIHEKKTQYF